METVLIERLSQLKYLCATADAWSSRCQSYLGVTIHFLNTEPFKRESYVIGFKRILFKQTNDELARAINNIFLHFKIRKEQLRNIVTDGGSNFCKMFKVYGKPLDAFDCENEESDDQTDAIDTDPTDTDTANSQFMVDANGELFRSEIIDFENGNDCAIDSVSDGTNDDALDSYFGDRNVCEAFKTTTKI